MGNLFEVYDVSQHLDWFVKILISTAFCGSILFRKIFYIHLISVTDIDNIPYVSYTSCDL